MSSEISMKRKIYGQIKSKYLYWNRTLAFKRRYKNYDESLFNRTLSKEVINKYKNRWSAYGVMV